MDKDLLNFENFIIKTGKSDFSISNYNSIDLSEVRNYLDGLPDFWFTHLKIHEGSKIEKVLYEYYKTDNFYDLILFLNKRDMVFDMPYSYDVIIDAVEKDIAEYQYKVFGNTIDQLSEKASLRLKEKLDNSYSKNNEKYIYLKVITTDKINIVRRKIENILTTQKEMYAILEE